MKKFFQGLLADVTPSRTSLFGKVFWGFIGLFVTLKPEVADNSAPAKKIDPEVVEQEIADCSSLVDTSLLAQKKLEADADFSSRIDEILDEEDSEEAFALVTSIITWDSYHKVEMLKAVREETGLGLKEAKALVDLAELHAA